MPQSNLPFLFVQKKLFCMFIAAVQVIAFILLAIFSKTIRDELVFDSDATLDEVDSLRAKYTTAILIFTIGGAVVHVAIILGIFFEHLYITAVVALLEIGTIIGALLEAIMIYKIFWFSFGISMFLMAALALHLFDLLTIYNFEPVYKSTRAPTVEEEDAE